MARLRVERLTPTAALPYQATLGAAGMDITACLPDEGEISLSPGSRALVPTGLRFRIPEGWELQVRPRSGLAIKHGVTVLNTPGTIDADYRGELKIVLYNAGVAPYSVRHGDRIAQIVMCSVPIVVLEEGPVDVNTPRGAAGFGSTGV